MVELWLSAGIGAGVITAMITLVRLAIGAERRRADDWRTAALTSAAANQVLSANVDKLVSTVEQMAASQRESLTLLQSLARRQEML